MGFGDFIGKIAGPAGTIIGGAIGGPAGAAIGGGLGSAAGNLFGGGGSSGGGGGGGSMGGGISQSDIFRQQEAMLDKLLGYETPGTQFLENYTQNVFMDATEDYKDSRRAKDTFGNIMDAVQSENLDPFTAQAFMASKLRPNSQFYGTDDFTKLINAEVGSNKQNTILDDAFATNYFRTPTAKETRYYKGLANSMGMNKSPMQFSSFLNSRLANSLEGARKGPLNNYETAAQAYYGGMIRNKNNEKTYTYNVYGLPTLRDEPSRLINEFA